MIVSINPASLKINAEILSTPVDEIGNIVVSAKEAQIHWANLKFQKKLEYLFKIKDKILSDIDDIARIITLDNGKPLLEAVNSEIYPVLDMFKFCATDARKALQNEKVYNHLFSFARIESNNIFEPSGVIGIISPWNFPFAIPMTQILMALIAGNTVIFKPSALTALVGNKIKQLFETVDLPYKIVYVVQGQGKIIGERLVEYGLNRIVFTGSISVGKHLMAKAAETLTPIILELGGKDPFIVLDDADVERASSAAVWGAFLNAGQVCASVERVYIDKRISEKFISKVIAKTKKLRVGNGLEHNIDMGPLISEEQINIVENHLKDALKKGAHIITGGHRITDLKGYFFEPTVLVDVNHTMDCMMEETFGPTLPIMEFSDIAEAVELANDTKYGLNASVWSSNIAKAKKIASSLQAGAITINNCLLTYGFAQCPWGGVKQSGIGRTHSIHGLYEFTNIKNLTVNRNLLKEDLWWYPYSEAKYSAMKAIVETIFCRDMLCRKNSLVVLLKTLWNRGNSA